MFNIQLDLFGDKVPPRSFNHGIPYMGSKRYINTRILQTIYNTVGSDFENFYDLFGGGGAISLLAAYMKHNTHYNDLNKGLHELFYALINGAEIPYKFIIRDDYWELIKDEGLTGAWVGITFSFYNNNIKGYFCSKEREEYYHKEYNKYLKGEKHDTSLTNIIYPVRMMNNISKNRHKYNFNKIITTCKEYNEINIKKDSVIYCDIPYKGNSQYQLQFDHKKFYEWAHNVKAPVFISEYDILDDFILVNELKDYKRGREKVYWNGVKAQ